MPIGYEKKRLGGRETGYINLEWYFILKHTNLLKALCTSLKCLCILVECRPMHLLFLPAEIAYNGYDIPVMHSSALCSEPFQITLII